MMSDNYTTYEEEGVYIRENHQQDNYAYYDDDIIKEEDIIVSSKRSKSTTQTQTYQVLKSEKNYQLLIPVTSIAQKDIQINLVRKTLQVLIKPKIRSEKGLFNQKIVLPKVVNRKAITMGYRKGQLVITVDL